MNADETRRAAQVMLDSLKEGAVVEYRHIGESMDSKWTAIENRDPMWEFSECDYRIAEPKHTKIADLPPVCWVRKIGTDIQHLLRSVDNETGTLLIESGWTALALLKASHEYSADRINWTPFV